MIDSIMDWSPHNQSDDLIIPFESLHFSQPVFACHLNTTASTIRKWEQGETRPTGPALKLLNVLADKGLQAII